MVVSAIVPEHGRMDIAVVLVPLGLLSAAGAAAAGIKAASPELGTGRRVELGVLAGLLALVTLFLALVGYWMWQFSRSFTF